MPGHNHDESPTSNNVEPIDLDIEDGLFEAPNEPNEAFGLVKRAVNAYFEPNRLESEGLYRALGVKAFKKYVPTSGDIVTRKLGVTLSPLKLGGANNIEKLHRFDLFTRTYEAIHLGGFALFSAIYVEGKGYNSAVATGVISGMQALMNVYPIMLQRYNRLRTHKIMGRIASRQASAE